MLGFAHKIQHKPGVSTKKTLQTHPCNIGDQTKVCLQRDLGLPEDTNLNVTTVCTSMSSSGSTRMRSFTYRIPMMLFRLPSNTGMRVYPLLYICIIVSNVSFMLDSSMKTFSMPVMTSATDLRLYSIAPAHNHPEKFMSGQLQALSRGLPSTSSYCKGNA